MMRVALAGFGSSGQTIHAPLLHEAGCDVVAVSTRDPERAAAARAEVPGTSVVDDLTALLAVPGNPELPLFLGGMLVGIAAVVVVRRRVAVDATANDG